MNSFLFKDRNGQTPLPHELQKGLRLKHIQTIGELDEVEEANIADGLVWLSHQKSAALDHAFWLLLHAKLFGDVWSWAGKIRAHELANEDFAASHTIRDSLRSLEGDLAYWINDNSMPRDELIARFHERLETIHPFANGNGRWGRILAGYVSERQGIGTATWRLSPPASANERRKIYLEALRFARRDGDYAPLAHFIFDR